MKKFLPFLFPLIALIIVFVMVLRWYNEQTAAKQGQIPDSAAVIQVDPLATADANRLRQPGQPAKDTSSVEMNGAQHVLGQIRYELKNGQVLFSVIANLPKPSSGVYQVWVAAQNQQNPTKAFVLTLAKGGYEGSGQIPANLLPVTISVTNLTNLPNQTNLPVLSGIIKKEAPQQNE